MRTGRFCSMGKPCRSHLCMRNASCLPAADGHIIISSRYVPILVFWLPPAIILRKKQQAVNTAHAPVDLSSWRAEHLAVGVGVGISRREMALNSPSRLSLLSLRQPSLNSATCRTLKACMCGEEAEGRRGLRAAGGSETKPARRENAATASVWLSATHTLCAMMEGGK